MPRLIAALLSLRCGSQQALLDSFFGSIAGQPGWQRGVSDRALAQARERLHMPALQALNTQVVNDAQRCGLVPLWRGRRLVAADGSVLRPAIRPCHRTVGAASADQRLFCLYLAGAELTLHASVYSSATGERTMLMDSLDRLSPDDVLLLDRGYPAAWLVQCLHERGIDFIMRCDRSSGWPAVRAFMRSNQPEAIVTLNVPSAQDAADWGCQRIAPRVRLVRQIAPSGAVRVLATSLSAEQASVQDFAQLYHARWRLEEAFKRLKHRQHLEAVSGLTQQALVVDVAAKILADNLISLLCTTAQNQHLAGRPQQRCNRAYASAFMQRMLPRLVLLIDTALDTIATLIEQLAANTQRLRPGRSQPRPAHHFKPHPRYAYKG